MSVIQPTRVRIASLMLLWGFAACDAPAPVHADADATTEDAAEVDDGAPADTVPVPTVAMRLVPFDFFTSDPVEGVAVCVEATLPEGQPPCATSTLEGGVFLVPRNRELVVTLTRDDLYGTVFAAPARDRDFAYTIPLFRGSVVEAAAAVVGVTLDPTKGHVLALVSERGTNGSDPVLDAHFSLEGEGEGPFYIGANGFPDASATGTSAIGAAVFFNLPPGQARVSVAHDARTCVLHGPGFDDPDHADVAALPVHADTLSHANFRCPP